MKKYVTKIAIMLALITVFGTFGLFGCGSKGGGGGSVGDDGKVYLTFAGRSNESEKANYIAFIDAFMEANPKYVVTLEWYPNEIAYMLAMNGKGKNLPDIFMLGNDRFIAYADAGLLFDYKDYLAQEDLDLIYENGYASYCYDRTTGALGYDKNNANMGLYGLPKDQGPYVMFYNKDLFKQLSDRYYAAHGTRIEYPSATRPYTYAEFIDVCKKLTLDSSTSSAGVRACAGYDIVSAVYSNNADFFTNNAKTSAILEDNFVEAIEFMQDLFLEGVLPPYGGSETANESKFTSGSSLFYFGGPSKRKDYWNVVDFEWDICPVAVGPAEGAVSKSYIGGMGYCISANSNVKEYCIKLAKYLAMDEESQRLQYQRGQTVPNLFSLKEEFCNDTLNLIGSKCPASRSVWLDIVDGAGTQKTDEQGEYTDIVTGKYRPEAYTYNSTWLTNLRSWLAGQGTNGKCVWKNEISARDALAAYNEVYQLELDEMWDNITLIDPE